MAAVLALACCSASAAERARNVILFVADAGGIPTLHAASLHGHDHPQALFVQQLPHLALMDTSAADRWVTDSAAGMSAIVTGVKTKNGVLSQAADAVPQEKDGAPLQTILEHAEQRGLATGVITNQPVTDATPAACYAHSHHRSRTGEIFAQLTAPRFGDGVDLLVGGGRRSAIEATRALGIDIEARLSGQGYRWLQSPADIPAHEGRLIALADDRDFDPLPVVAHAIEILSRNPNGYFLMVEWDAHTNELRRGLDRLLTLDDLVRQTAAQVGPDTLIIFTADHSFDLRVRGGKPGESLLPLDPTIPLDGKSDAVRVDDGHTGEQVLTAAQGPGAERVRGFIDNTDLFRIMLAAYGWEGPAAESAHASPERE